MNRSIWNKRFPTYIAFIFILIGLGITTFLVKSGIIVFTKATPSEEPQNVQISNITTQSFTVSYTTTAAVTGALSYGKTTLLGTTEFDTKTPQETTTHVITVNNVDPKTTYYFSITNGSNQYLNNGVPFQVTTAAPIEGASTSFGEIKGTILKPDGQPAQDVTLLIEGDDLQLLSARTQQDGTYVIPLSSVRNKSLSSYAQLQPTDILTLTALHGGQKSTARFFVQQINPIPTITLSNNYDFTISSAPLLEEQRATSSAEFQLPVSSQIPQQASQIQLITPKENESFVDQRPVFRGRALPNSTVTILIESSHEIRAQIQTDSVGNWTFRPEARLTPGQHTITITTRDRFGVLKRITQSFTVFAVGSQVSESATPSATPIVTTPSPTPTRISSPTPTPTVVRIVATPVPSATNVPDTPTPTQTLTPTPTVSPSPTLVVIQPTKPPRQPTIEPPGSPSFIVTALGAFVTTLTGIIIFFIASGGSPL